MNKGRSVWEEDLFWDAIYPFMFPPEQFLAAGEQAEKILSLLGARGGRVLDLCCGPGRHSVAMAELGYVVTGVDKSRYLLEKARAYGSECEGEVEWVEEDMRDFLRANTYDLAINVYTAFGFFEDPADDLLVLGNVHSSLRAGGKFALELPGKERIAASFQSSECHRHPNGSLLAIRREITNEFTKMRSEWTVICADGVRTFEMQCNLYSAQELRHAVEMVGFRNVAIFGDWDGSAYGIDAKSLIVRAEK